MSTCMDSSSCESMDINDDIKPDDISYARIPDTPPSSQTSRRGTTPGEAAPSPSPPTPSSVQPIASTSRLIPITPPSTPKRNSRSAQSSSSRRRRSIFSPKTAPIVIPFDKLIAAGTIVLHGCRLDSDSVEGGSDADGWRQITRSLLVQEDEVDEHYAHSQADAAGWRETLEDLLVLQDADLLRATAKESLPGVLVVRVYLIPTDLEEIRNRRGKSPAAAVVLGVWRSIRMELDEWNGRVNVDGTAAMMLGGEDNRSLLELYRAIESPPFITNSYDSLENASEETKARVRDSFLNAPPGFKTQLFDYQRCSLAKMLARELAPQHVVHPSFEARCGLDGKPFYVDGNGDVTLTPRKVIEPKGGILADAMGSGKTAICLALILATLGDLPKFDAHEPPLVPPLVMTNVSLLGFPFKPYIEERRKLRPRVQPLLSGVAYDAFELDDHASQMRRQEIEDANETMPPLPSLQDILINLIRTTSNKPLPSDADPDSAVHSPSLTKLRISSPFYHLHPTVEQKSSRLGRNSTHHPRQIFLSSATLVVVPATLVRQWEDEVKKHVELGALRMISLRTAKDEFPFAVDIANDYDLVLISNSRFARFADPLEDARKASPLRQIVWKRLLVDEGHVLAGGNGTRQLAQDLLCESRWAITGTPTTNLRGAPQKDEGALMSIDSAAGGDIRDFDRLGALFSGFIRHPAFPPKSQVWRNIFTKPILGEQRGAERLLQTLNRGIVRNQAERISLAYKLPPLVSQVQEIRMRETETKTYNAVASMFLVNAILTQRVDEDYFFHPENRKHLDQLSVNFSSSTFFFASESQRGYLVTALEEVQKAVEGEKILGWTEEDRISIKEARAHIAAALEDPIWNMVHSSLTVGVEVFGLDKTLVSVFGGLWLSDKKRKSIVPSSGLVMLRSILQVVRASDTANWEDDEDLIEEIVTFHQRLQHNIANPADQTPIPSITKKPKKSQTLWPLPADSTLKHIELGQSTSSKLNHVVDELLKYPDEKFLIFADCLSDLLFANLAEVLDLIGIPVVVFSGSSSKIHDRGAAVARFNTVDVKLCRALLIDARLGGRGMDLSAASRVIFLTPIWSPDLESQASKRAHRLGQTRSVNLSRLVVPDSYEDAMLRRRQQLTSADISHLKNPQLDTNLQHVLQSAKFLEHAPQTEDLDACRRFKLLSEGSEREESHGGGSSTGEVRGPGGVAIAAGGVGAKVPKRKEGTDDAADTPAVKKRKVHFA